jgi:hypothetical protein
VQHGDKRLAEDNSWHSMPLEPTEIISITLQCNDKNDKRRADS